MKRLTKNGRKADKVDSVECYKILGAYENTGLTSQEITVLKKAFEIACNDMADSSCPHEYDLYECEKCDECPHQGEIHEDTERDIECWKQYYMKKAEEVLK